MDIAVLAALTAMSFFFAILGAVLKNPVPLFAAGIMLATVGVALGSTGINYQTGVISNYTSGNFTQYITNGSSYEIVPVRNSETSVNAYTNQNDATTTGFAALYLLLGVWLGYESLLAVYRQYTGRRGIQ